MVQEDFKVVVSEAQLGKQIGNSMSVNLLERLFVRLLPFANLIPEGIVLADRYQGQRIHYGALVFQRNTRQSTGALDRWISDFFSFFRKSNLVDRFSILETLYFQMLVCFSPKSKAQGPRKS